MITLKTNHEWVVLMKMVILPYFLGDVFLLYLPLRGAVLLPRPRPPAGWSFRGNRLHVLSEGACRQRGLEQRNISGPVFPDILLSLSLSLAENLGRHSGVAAGCNTGLLCPGPRLWVCYCLLFLQPKEQQLPPRCLHSLYHKLPHIGARHSRGVRCARLPRQTEGHGMHQQVYLVKKNTPLCRQNNKKTA